MKHLISFILFLSVCKTAGQQNVSTFFIEAQQLKTAKKIWLYLPKNYAFTTQNYPVIYMPDGQNLFGTGTWEMNKILDDMDAKVIVVGIENENNRTEELTPFKNPTFGGGNADNYLDFIVSTLKPKIDSGYRTKPNTKNTAIWGSEQGGLTAFYAVLKYPEVFGKAGCFSPNFGFNRNEMMALMEQTPKFKAKVYLLCGENKKNTNVVSDIKNVAYWMNTRRCECQKLNKTVIVKNRQDDEKLWRENFKKAYLWLF